MRSPAITHPDRVLFPDSGVTKLQLAEYYRRVASRLLPHLKDRPLSLVRCPDGIDQGCFYQKHWTGSLPSGLRTVRIRQADGARRPYVVVESVAGLVHLVQFGVIELHPWGSRVDDLDHPDRIIFDLDPGAGVPWRAVRQAARTLHELLVADGMRSWVKTTGGKGLHVVVPIGRGPSWEEAHDFARDVAERLSRGSPDRYLATARKSARHGKVFIDWLRNVRGATAVAPWSVRARSGAPVSAPWSWQRLGNLRGAAQVTVPSIRRNGVPADPWTGFARCRQRIRRPGGRSP